MRINHVFVTFTLLLFHCQVSLLLTKEVNWTLKEIKRQTAKNQIWVWTQFITFWKILIKNIPRPIWVFNTFIDSLNKKGKPFTKIAVQNCWLKNNNSLEKKLKYFIKLFLQNGTKKLASAQLLKKLASAIALDQMPRCTCTQLANFIKKNFKWTVLQCNTFSELVLN